MSEMVVEGDGLFSFTAYLRAFQGLVKIKIGLNLHLRHFSKFLELDWGVRGHFRLVLFLFLSNSVWSFSAAICSFFFLVFLLGQILCLREKRTFFVCAGTQVFLIQVYEHSERIHVLWALV